MRSACTASGLWAISAYQRFVSPHKGFRCAHHARTGGPTCSNYGKQVLREFGFLDALSLLRLRLAACAQVAQAGEADSDDGPKPMSEEEKKACIQLAACTCGNFLPRSSSASTASRPGGRETELRV